jgi:hypothetical protein
VRSRGTEAQEKINAIKASLLQFTLCALCALVPSHGFGAATAKPSQSHGPEEPLIVKSIQLTCGDKDARRRILAEINVRLGDRYTSEDVTERIVRSLYNLDWTEFRNSKGQPVFGVFKLEIILKRH